jgi:excisionase family DNA binding protein
MDLSIKELIREAISEAMTQPQVEKATLTIDECAEFSGIGRNKLLELVHASNTDFPCFKVGVKFLINRQMLITWLEKISKEKRIL